MKVSTQATMGSGPDFDTELAKFTPRQMEAVRSLDSGKTKFLLYGGALGGGKALSLNTKIPTISGWKTMGDIQPGDVVFDEKGNPCRVIGVTRVFYGRPCYRVVFSDGSEFIADAEHEWWTFDAKDRAAVCRRSDGYRSRRRTKRELRGTGKRPDLAERNRIIKAGIKQPPTGDIRTTTEIASTIKYGSVSNHSVEVAKPLILPNAVLPIDPYVLGVWLGDGTGVQGAITTADEEIITIFEKCGYQVTKRESSRYCYGVKRLMASLRSLGVLGDKHIPQKYLRASIYQRLALLQGLMDTDGTADRNDGRCEYYSCNKRLAEDVYELVVSLGVKATIRTGRAKLNGKDCGEKYRVGFTTAMPVFRLKRKLVLQAKTVRPTQKRRMIVSVKQVESVPVRCIQVDSPSHLYLAGESMVPTHNSYFLRWWSLRRLYILAKVFGVKQPVGMLACEDYPSLKDRQLSKISREFPPWFGRMHQDHKEYGRCFIIHPNWGGGILCFRNLDDPSKYASAEFCFICIDELTKNTYEVFDHVRTRARWKGLPDIECQFVAGSNPGSIGHAWVKQFWMDKLFPPEWISPIDYSQSFAYVPSKADDNPHLDPAYWSMLETLAPSLRKAFRDGDWNIFLGQAFPELSKEAHACDPITIPKGASIYSTFDWGFGAPFSFGWWWVDGDGRIYRFHEFYGWNGQPNHGLRLSDEEIATRAIKIERSILPDWVDPSWVQRLAGHDIFQKKPDYKGGGQGPSTAEVFANVGIKERHAFIWRVGDPSRPLKIRQFHERLRRHDHEGNPIRPMLQVYPGCDHFFRTIGSLIQDEHNIEDVDTTGEDHVYDESCLICMARPLALPEDKPKLSATDRRIDGLIRGDRGSFNEIATIEQERELARLQSGRDSWDGIEDDEGSGHGDLYPTI